MYRRGRQLRKQLLTYIHGGLLFVENKDMETGIKRQTIEEIIGLAQQYQIEKVILFGSRARGDYHRTSDIDLAIKGGNVVRFALDVEELTTTLLKFDVVDLDGAVQDDLLQSIMAEGVTVYEKDCLSIRYDSG